jgi:hypothetical protein
LLDESKRAYSWRQATRARQIAAMKIATFNVNGVNGRLPVLLRDLEETSPGVICQQDCFGPAPGGAVGRRRRPSFDGLWRRMRDRHETSPAIGRRLPSSLIPGPSPIARRKTGVLPNALWEKGRRARGWSVTLKGSPRVHTTEWTPLSLADTVSCRTLPPPLAPRPMICRRSVFRARIARR